MFSRLRTLVPLLTLALLAVMFGPAVGTAQAASAAGVTNDKPIHREPIPADFAGVNYAAAPQNVEPILRPGKTTRLWDLGTNWCNIEPHPNTWDWTNLSAAVSKARRQGYTQIILVLGMTPQWASTGKRGRGTGASYVCQDTPGASEYTTTMPKLDAWKGYVSAVAEKFKGRITAYEVWNEPTSRDYWTGKAGANTGTKIREMSQLTTLAYTTIKHNDPAAKVLSASLTPRSAPHDWNQKYVQQIASDGWHVDGIAFHSYSYSHSVPGTDGIPIADVPAMVNDHTKQVEKVKGYLRQAHPQPPKKHLPISLWETELNHNVGCQEPGCSTLSSPLGDDVQVQLVGRTFMDDLRLGVDHELWYAFNKPLFGVSLDTGNAYQALRTMQGWVTGYTFDHCSYTSVSNVTVTHCYLKGTLNDRAIVWAAQDVTVSGLDRVHCTLPDGACDSPKNVMLTPTPQLVMHLIR